MGWGPQGPWPQRLALRANRKVLGACAAELLEHETLDADQLGKLTEGLHHARNHHKKAKAR